jgi:hypothetical protein
LFNVVEFDLGNSRVAFVVECVKDEFDVVVVHPLPFLPAAIQGPFRKVVI